MHILFCEYTIELQHLEQFQEWVTANPDLWRAAQLLENTGQPGVHVEIWRVTGEEDALHIQKERLEGRSEWRRMDAWVKGGRAGLHLWTFRSVIENA